MQQSGRQLRRHFSRRAQFSYATHCHKHHALKKGQNPFTKEENCWLLQDALVATSSDCKPYQTAGFHCQKLRGPRKKKESSVNLISFSSWRHLPTPEHWADPRPDPAQQFSCSYISIYWDFSPNEQALKPSADPVMAQSTWMLKASIHTWCRQPPSLDHGCRGSSPRDYTCRSGCSTCSTPSSSLSSAWLDEWWPNSAERHG